MREQTKFEKDLQEWHEKTIDISSPVNQRPHRSFSVANKKDGMPIGQTSKLIMASFLFISAGILIAKLI